MRTATSGSYHFMGEDVSDFGRGELARLLAAVGLFKALGGGWSRADG